MRAGESPALGPALLPVLTSVALVIVTKSLAERNAALPEVRIPVDRMVLAKRRWRGVAEDGAEFGFDLEKALPDGALVHQGAVAVYVLAQKYEPVLEVNLASNPAVAAKLGWMIGNLHFPLEVTEGVIRVADDSALRQMFEREGVTYVTCKRVFHPLGGGHSHGHHHH